MFGSLQIIAIAVALSLSVGFYGGWRVKAAFVAQDALRAVQASRQAERQGVQIAYQADIRYIDRLHEAKGRSDANSARLQRALAANATDLAACRISADVLRVLQPPAGVPPAPRAAGEPRPAPAAVDPGPGTTCAAVVESYQQNRDEVAEPNSIQLRAIQEFYRDLRERLNAGRR